jgi:dipeptide/tripeptide permease
MAEKESIFKQYPSTFWVANFMEIFERMSWYGFFALSSLYITGAVSDGGLGFTSEDRGLLQGIVTFFIYLFPFFTGALGDRFGFKKMLLISYCVLSPAYYLLGQMKTMPTFFAAFMLVGVGAAIFKPLIVGTIGKTTNTKNSSMGFGIFYMMVNVGGFAGPFIAAAIRNQGWRYVFIASSIWIALNIPLLLLFYKEPPRDEAQSSKTFGQVMKEMVEVLGNGRFFIFIFAMLAIFVMGSKWLSVKDMFIYAGVWLALNLVLDFLLKFGNASQWCMRVGNTRFLLFLLLLSSFWVAFNQIFLTLPEYIRDFSDTSRALNSIINFLNTIGLPESWVEVIKNILATPDGKIKPEQIININALAIIFFQVVVSVFVAKMRPLVTIMVGIAVTAGSFLLLILGINPWISMLGVFIFSFGEMMASPKAKEYTAHYVAPQDKVGMYMGYYMWSVALGNLFGGILSGRLYGTLARDMQRPDIMWAIFAGISVFCAMLLYFYHKTIGVKVEKERAQQAQA